MRFIADKARRNNNFGRDDALSELSQLRRNIAYVAMTERLSNNTIADLLEGTYTGDSYRQLNETLRRRGGVSMQTRAPIGYPSELYGSKSSTRLDRREILPGGSLVSVSGPVAAEGGFWRADYEDSMVKDISEDVAFNPELARNRMLSRRVAAVSVEQLINLALKSDQQTPGTPMRKELWESELNRLLGKFTAHDFGEGKILFIAKRGTTQFLVVPNENGLYEEFSSGQAFKKLLLNPAMSARDSSVTDELEGVPNRYKSNIEKATRIFPGNVFAFNKNSSEGHVRLWLLDEFGLPVSHRAAGMSSSPGRNDAIYIANYILDRAVRDKFETIRGRLTADPDYLYTLAPYIGMPDTGIASVGAMWKKAPSIDPTLDNQLIWQIDIPLDANRNPASGSDIATNLQIDVYEMPQNDGSRIFRLMGQAINGESAEIYEITVDFPTRESAVAYALSEASPFPHHAWATNIDSARKRLPEGLDEKLVIDPELKKLLAGDRVLSSVVGLRAPSQLLGKEFISTPVE